MGANVLHLAQTASTMPATFVVASVWQGLLLTGIAWLGLEALPKTILGKAWQISPRTRFLLWMSVFILSTLLPFTTLLHSAAQGPEHVATLVPAVHFQAYWAVVLSCIWALASLVSLSRLFVSGFSLQRIVRNAETVSHASLTEEMQAILRDAGTREAPVALALSNSVDSPMVIGFFHRTIVLPAWLWARLSAAELSQVVLHETAHLKRGDDWTNLLQKTLRALFPLNPALFFAERRLCWEREMACDDAVLGRSVSPREYALCLTSLAEKGLLNRLQTLAPGAWRKRSELAERVHRILRNNSSLKPLRSRPVVAGFLAMLLLSGAALTRCPQLVTFTVAEPVASLAREVESPATFERASLLTTNNIHSRRAPHLVEASLRMTIPSRAFHAATDRSMQGRSRGLSRSGLSTQGRHVAASRRAHVRPIHPGFVQTAFVSNGDPLPVSSSNEPQLFFAVYGIELPADGSVPSTNLPSQAGWIIVQL